MLADQSRLLAFKLLQVSLELLFESRQVVFVAIMALRDVVF